jgi:hypothetical protein
VLTLIIGVVKLAVVAREDPPLETSYQLYVPVDPLAESVTVPVPHLDPSVLPGAVGIVLKVAVTVVLGPSQF